MVSQFELKIMPETDPSSLLPSRALTDQLLVALPRVKSKHPRQDRLVAARTQSEAYAPLCVALPTIAVVVRPITGPWFREQS